MKRLHLATWATGLPLALAALALLVVAALPRTTRPSFDAGGRQVRLVPVRDWGFGGRTFVAVGPPDPGGDLWRDRVVYRVHQTRLGPVVVSTRRRMGRFWDFFE